MVESIEIHLEIIHSLSSALDRASEEQNDFYDLLVLCYHLI